MMLCLYSDVLAKIFKEGGLKWMYNLIKCEQPQLIAEGLIAINILVVIMKGSVHGIYSGPTNCNNSNNYTVT